MGAAFEFLIVIVIGLVWLLGLAISVLLLVWGIFRPSLTLKWIGAIGIVGMLSIAALIVGSIVWISQHPPQPRAADIVRLPGEAIVLKVEPQFYAGDGTVVFAMPPDTKTPNQWVDEIWAANSPAAARQPGVKLTVDLPHNKQFDPGEGVFDIEYDPQTEFYRFKIDKPD